VIVVSRYETGFTFDVTAAGLDLCGDQYARDLLVVYELDRTVIPEIVLNRDFMENAVVVLDDVAHVVKTTHTYPIDPPADSSVSSRRVNWEVFVTCAVTGVGDTVSRSDRVPITPAQIADAAIEAAQAGAAVVHIHVRDPESGKGSRDPQLYREVVERIRSSGVDIVLNLTAGMGGDLVLGGAEAPLPFEGAGTDLAGVEERLVHIQELRPEICTIDCGTMNFAAGGDYVMVNTPSLIREMARRVREFGVRPELEVFDTGHLVLVHELIRDGLVEEPVLIQLCTGIPYGAPDDPATLLSMVHRLPPGAIFSAFSIGRMQLPFVALAPLIGGNVRVGLEDNIYLSRGLLAGNGELVERAIMILEAMNVRILGPDKVREQLALRRA
jgi:uncharacterized protein (DUF849 family)